MPYGEFTAVALLVICGPKDIVNVRKRQTITAITIVVSSVASSRATAPTDDEPARPAFRMFEGRPPWTGDGDRPWVRVLAPEEIPAIAEDLMVLDDDAVARHVVQRRWERGPEYAEYTLQYLQSARSFMTALARDGRGMVYTIG